jgi:hypothetical protein
MSIHEWGKRFPPLSITDRNPVRRSAAEIIAQYHQLTVADLTPMVEIDPRVINNLNVSLKYRTVIQLEK